MKKLIVILLVLSIFLFSLSAFAASLTGKVYISEKGGTLHLRASASTSSKSLGYVKQGDEVMILADYGEWLNIYVPRLELSGYLKAKYIIRDAVSTIDDVKPDTVYELPASFSLDLNGDGRYDILEVTVSYDEYEMELYSLVITLSDGTTAAKDLMPVCDAKIAFSYLSSNRLHMIISGDVMSSDYVTECIYLENNTIKNVSFSASDPFDSDILFPGSLDSIKDGVITLCPTLDTLGTRVYKGDFLLIGGVLTPVESFIWKCGSSVDDPEIWEYTSIRTLRNIACVIYDRPSVLPEGSEIIITALDASQRKAYFISDSGLTGYLIYSNPETDMEWGVKINGIHEEALFDHIPYAG